MDIAEALKIVFQYAFGLSGYGLTFFLALIGADSLLNKEKAEYYAEVLKLNFSEHRQSLAVVDVFVNATLPAITFLKNILVLTLVGVGGAVFQYVIWVEGFSYSLATDLYALRAFIAQVLTTGIPMVFGANFLAAMVYITCRQRAPEMASGLPLFMFDLAARILAFCSLMFVTYYFSASVLGAFQGNTDTALKAVLPTLYTALQFENLTSTYLLATVLGSVPLFVAAVLDLAGRMPALGNFLRTLIDHLPLDGKPIRTVGIVLAVATYLFFGLARMLIGVFSSGV
ncbi:MAG: hypothetical protein ABJN26_22590 [Stappiaceae bacterium]|uniref:hypothetical protein n=1 Tax=Roseibium sp. TaxID=1936156 RepID=UPI003297F9E3